MTTQETAINQQLAELVRERNEYKRQRDEANRAVVTLNAECNSLRDKMAVTMGVGDGSGQLFVHGDYESIKAAQRILDERSALAKELDEARGVIMDSDCDSPSAVLLNELREQHAALRLSAERARDFLASIESGLEDQVQGRVDVLDHTVLHWVRTEFSASLALCGLESALSDAPPSPDSVIESLRRTLAEAVSERDDLAGQVSILQDHLLNKVVDDDRWEKRVKLLERRNADAARVLNGEVTL